MTSYAKITHPSKELAKMIEILTSCNPKERLTKELLEILAKKLSQSKKFEDSFQENFYKFIHFHGPYLPKYKALRVSFQFNIFLAILTGADP